MKKEKKKTKSDAQRDAEYMTAVEFGFKQCEKGHNLEMALSEARKVLSGIRKGIL